MGLAVYPKLLAEALNAKVFPASTTFKVFTNDLRDRKAEADVRKAQADVIMALVGTAQAPGIISQQQGLNLAADWGLIPQEFLPASGDATPGGTLTSDEKPLSEMERTAVLPATKAIARPTIEREWDAALAWAEEAQV